MTPREAAKKLCPKGLPPEVKKEWLRLGEILAHPDLDRLKPHFVDAITDYSWLNVQIAKYRALVLAEGEFYSIDGRNGPQKKTHPALAQLNEGLRQRRALASHLGLSPSAERNIKPGQGPTADEGEDEFA